MNVIWFPCVLQPLSFFKFDHWEVRPGLKAGPMSDREKELWLGISNSPFKDSFKPNFLVQIDEREFIAALFERLRAQGHDPDKLIPAEFEGRVPLIAEDLLRWVLVSLSLCRTFDMVTPAARYLFQHGDKPGELISFSGVATHAGYDRSVFTRVPHHAGTAGPIDVDVLSKLAMTIEPYYQPVIWRHDPVSVALSCFWAFLFSRFPDQAYTSLVTILETLLSTGTAEIAHQISERVAILIGHSPDERLKVYRKMKELYGLRSRITHGDLELKKGVINWGTTIVSAKTTIVSIPTLTEMAQYATTVLRGVLENTEIMSAMDKKKEERKVSLDEFFLTRLFS